MISFIEAATIATTIQATLFGVYFTTFLLCLRWLLYVDDGWTVRKDIKWPWLIIAIVIFAFSVTDLALSLHGTLLALQGKKTLLFSGIVTVTVEALIAVITDAVLIYRCWVVYNKSWHIYYPNYILGLRPLLDLPGCALRTIDTRSRSFYISTIIINIFATSATIFQIWRNSIFPHPLQFTIRVVAESGLLYTITSVVSACLLFIRNSPTGPVILPAVATAINFPATGIAYNLILIRVAQHRISTRANCISALEFVTLVGSSSARVNANVTVENGRTDAEQGIRQGGRDGELPGSLY
ncbi:hypothetical protein AX15_002139 [Amanita polypyramis BW_CC]|nr:hypothetical protein AX15_002139 [Amanita polypyramis BW_CC]